MPNSSRTPSRVTINLKRALAETGMTQAMLAHLSGVSLRAVQKWLEGAQPSTTNLLAAASALGKEPSWFYVDHDADLKEAA